MKYAHVIQFAVERPWAITIEKLAAIQVFLALKAEGQDVDPDEVRAMADAARSTDARSAGSIAVVPLYGVLSQRGGLTDTSEPLTSTARFAALVQQAVNDPGVRAVVIDVDSPGGEVYGTAEAADAVAQAVQTGGKPIVAVANSLAASAAYWIASQAEELIVTPGGQVGSIGVYAMHQDVSQAAEQAGVKTTLVSAGKYKTEANPWQPLSEEAHAAIEQSVQDYYGQFLAAVARGRGTTSAAVRDGYGQGRVLTAKRALAAGMVDRVATLDQTISRLASGSYRKPGRAQAEVAAQVVDRADSEAVPDWRRRRLRLNGR